MRSLNLLHSRYFSLHQELKNEPVIKNSRTNLSLRIQDRFLYSRYIPVTFLLGTNPSSRIQERTRHQEFKNEPVKAIIKNSRSIYSSIFYIPVTFPLLSLHQEFKNEPVIKNSRANPSSRIQERTRHQEFQDQATNHRERSRNEPVYDFSNCMDYRGWNRLSISYNPGELK